MAENNTEGFPSGRGIVSRALRKISEIATKVGAKGSAMGLGVSEHTFVDYPAEAITPQMLAFRMYRFHDATNPADPWHKSFSTADMFNAMNFHESDPAQENPKINLAIQKGLQELVNRKILQREYDPEIDDPNGRMRYKVTNERELEKLRDQFLDAA